MCFAPICFQRFPGKSVKLILLYMCTSVTVLFPSGYDGVADFSEELAEYIKHELDNQTLSTV